MVNGSEVSSTRVAEYAMKVLPTVLALFAIYQAIFVNGAKSGQQDEHLKNIDSAITRLEKEKADAGKIDATIEGLREVTRITAESQSELRKLIEEQAGMYGGRGSARRN
jgi:hypothetical protein